MVPYDAGTIPPEELLHVAAALQVQVVRDLAPTWDISGVVSPFLALKDVPAEYIPLVIVSKPLPYGRPGFHFAVGGQPFAVIHYGQGWSLAASHELIEMICDPTGAATVTGPSLADAKALSPEAKTPIIDRQGEGELKYIPQGQVEYLMEVCDPCESSTYKINDVLVSDFVTPEYYRAFTADSGRYSFMGRVAEPRQVLEGGYLSWRARLPKTSLYQAIGDPEDEPSRAAVVDKALASEDQSAVALPNLTIRQLSDLPSRLSRDWIDAQTPPLFDFPAPPHGAGGPYYKVDPAAEKWAGKFHSEIAELLKLLEGRGARRGNASRLPDIDEVIRGVKLLASAKGYADFKGQPSEERKIFGREAPKEPQPIKYYKDILKALENQKRESGLFGPDLFDSQLALWMCMLTD